MAGDGTGTAGEPVAKTSAGVFEGRRRNEVGINPHGETGGSACWLTLLGQLGTSGDSLPNKSWHIGRFVGLFDPDPEGASDERPRFIIDGPVPRRIRGVVVGNVPTSAPTFQIASVTAVFGGKAPASPVTVQQVYPQGYVGGQMTEAIFNETSGQWHNLPAPVKLGCHLDVASYGFIYVTPASLAGSGLGVSFGTGPGGCDQLTATGGGNFTAGCGIVIAGGVVSVDPTDLAGDGLVADDTTCEFHVNTGCGLEVVDDKVQVNPAEIAGKGLHEASGSTCDVLELDLGCGLEFDAADKVAVKASDLAGAGLAPAAIGCGLDVKVGCGLEIVANTVRVKASDLAGEGLVVGENCKLDVNLGVGCGLDFDNVTDTIYFDALAVAGSGLVVEGTCSLRVNTGCGLDVAGDAVVVDPADLAGDGLVPQGTGCAIKFNTGCGLEITSDAVRVKIDPAGCLECNGTTGIKLKGDPVTIRSIKECELVIESGQLKLRLTYDEFDFCAQAGAVDQVEECAVNVFQCGS